MQLQCSTCCNCSDQGGLGKALRASSLVLSAVLSYEYLVSILWLMHDVGRSVDPWDSVQLSLMVTSASIG
jgi:hypothetical protein